MATSPPLTASLNYTIAVISAYGEFYHVPLTRADIEYQFSHYHQSRVGGLIAGVVIMLVVTTAAVALRLLSRRAKRVHLGADDYIAIIGLVMVPPFQTHLPRSWNTGSSLAVCVRQVFFYGYVTSYCVCMCTSLLSQLEQKGLTMSRALRSDPLRTWTAYYTSRRIQFHAHRASVLRLRYSIRIRLFHHQNVGALPLSPRIHDYKSSLANKLLDNRRTLQRMGNSQYFQRCLRGNTTKGGVGTRARCQMDRHSQRFPNHRSYQRCSDYGNHHSANAPGLGNADVSDEAHWTLRSVCDWVWVRHNRVFFTVGGLNVRRLSTWLVTD